MDKGSPVIEVRLREVNQLFDSLDPSPFTERDLDPKAEVYIVDSYREMRPGTPCALVVHLDGPLPARGAANDVVGPIHDHFTRQAERLHRELRRLLRRGWLSLGIGLGFLAAVFAISEAVGRVMDPRPMVQLLHQGLIIVGWVAMWRPLEIFLYDWWPIAGERRVFERLSRIEVRVVQSEPARSTPPVE